MIWVFVSLENMLCTAWEADPLFTVFTTLLQILVQYLQFYLQGCSWVAPEEENQDLIWIFFVRATVA